MRDNVINVDGHVVIVMGERWRRRKSENKEKKINKEK